ncbi:MAG: RidA family protein [Pseudomonadota bacterium]|nr:RidA family protein [Pseudomonadota bacterium]
MKRVKYENPEGAAPAQGLYSHAARVSAGDLLFVAGQLAVTPDGGVAGKNDFAAQFQCVFDNLGDVLKGLGASWTDIAKFTTYLVHSQDLEQFMALRADLFPKLFGDAVFPPNTLLMVDRLVKEEFLIEIEAVVAVPGE